jgi:hypothetical protein
MNLYKKIACNLFKKMRHNPKFFIKLLLISQVLFFSAMMYYKLETSLLDINLDGIYTQDFESDYSKLYFYKKFSSKCQCKNHNQIVLFKNSALDYYFHVNLTNKLDGLSQHLYQISNNELKNFKITCDPYKVLKRGKSQKVISYSLYGKEPIYYNKLRRLTQIINEKYPEWIIRIYYDHSINQSIICELECQKNPNSIHKTYFDNVDFCDAETINLNLKDYYFYQYKETERVSLNLSYIHSMKWRWLPIGDDFVDIFSSRDTDSYILQREIDSVKVWLDSDKVGHIMRGINKLLINSSNFILGIFLIF